MPEVEINITGKDEITHTKEVTITAEDETSGLSEGNEYKYCITTHQELDETEEWNDYELGQSFEIGEGLSRNILFTYKRDKR